MREFRLLRVDGGFERRDLARDLPKPQSPISVEFSPSSANINNPSWTSVVIGKNGVGKSRMLAGIVDIFEAVESGQSRRRVKDASVSSIEYLCSGEHCKIEFSEAHQVRTRVNGKLCAPDAMPMPSKVIALTTTPFDKFRVPRRLPPMPYNVDREVNERYTYLGLRDRTGRASPTAVIYRALEGLFDASEASLDRRERVAGVFEFLGYKPQIEVEYYVGGANSERLEKLSRGYPWEALYHEASQSRRLDNSYFGRVQRMIDENPRLSAEIADISAQVLERANGRGLVTLKADFFYGSDDNDLFRRMQVLRRMNLLKMRGALVERAADGIVLDLKLASSGELGIVTGFLGLASVIEEGSLIFIDEPEISLHPEWQTSYIDLLLQTFKGVAGCHFVLATHSPLILSDIAPQYSTVVSLDRTLEGKPIANELSGKSADYLLVNAFRVAGKNNLYLKQEVIKALRLAADGKAGTEEFAKTIAPMSNLLGEMDADSPVATVINELVATGQKARDS